MKLKENVNNDRRMMRFLHNREWRKRDDIKRKFGHFEFQATLSRLLDSGKIELEFRGETQFMRLK